MTPIPVGVQRLAAQLAHRMPWLVRNRHIGALARLLHRHQLDGDAGWSAERLLRVIELQNRATGHRVLDPADQRNPLGYLNTLLTGASERLTNHSPVAAVPRPAPAWRVEDKRRREELANEDPALRAAIIAQIRADIAADEVRRSITDADKIHYTKNVLEPGSTWRHAGHQ